MGEELYPQEIDYDIKIAIAVTSLYWAGMSMEQIVLGYQDVLIAEYGKVWE